MPRRRHGLRIQARLGEGGRAEAPLVLDLDANSVCRRQKIVIMLHSSLKQAAAAFEVRFQSLLDEGRAMVFPCDSEGRVNLDALCERSRNNYLFARRMIGREYATPRVLACESSVRLPR